MRCCLLPGSGLSTSTQSILFDFSVTLRSYNPITSLAYGMATVLPKTSASVWAGHFPSLCARDQIPKKTPICKEFTIWAHLTGCWVRSGTQSWLMARERPSPSLFVGGPLGECVVDPTSVPRLHGKYPSPSQRGLWGRPWLWSGSSSQPSACWGGMSVLPPEALIQSSCHCLWLHLLPVELWGEGTGAEWPSSIWMRPRRATAWTAASPPASFYPPPPGLFPFKCVYFTGSAWQFFYPNIWGA